jgi:hypothetical protein
LLLLVLLLALPLTLLGDLVHRGSGDLRCLQGTVNLARDRLLGGGKAATGSA